MGTLSTVKSVAPGTLVAVAFLAFLVLPALAGAEDGWISGTITSGILGDPMAGATVNVQNATYSGTTDTGGNYNISVPPGNYTVKASATNYADKVSGTLQVTAGNTTGYSTYLEKLKGSLSGRITDYDDSTPIQYISVTPEGSLVGGAMTDADGRYSFDSIDVGNYKMDLTPLPPYSATNFTVVIKAGQNVVKDIRLKSVSMVVFTVKDSGGKPILGATITVGNYSTTTDVDGLATLEVAPYHYVWKVQADGYKTVIQDDTVNKGDIKAYSVSMTKVSSGGGGAGIPLALVGGAAVAVVVVLLVVVIFMRRKKAPSGGPAGSPGAAGAGGEAAAPGAPPGQKTQAQKMKEWADFEKMYGKPHPDAPGWISAGAAAASAPKPKCPKDGGSVTFEPFSGQYFCSKCDQRYTADQVFRNEDVVLLESRPAEAAARAPGSEEPTKLAAGEKLDLSTAQPSWALEHGQTMTGEDYVAVGQPAPAAAVAPAPPDAPPMEAAPVSDEEPAAEAAPVSTPEGVNPEAGPLFSMPKPIDYTDLPPPPPPKEPPKLEGDN
jgi:hypothetical protein